MSRQICPRLCLNMHLNLCLILVLPEDDDSRALCCAGDGTLGKAGDTEGATVTGHQLLPHRTLYVGSSFSIVVGLCEGSARTDCSQVKGELKDGGVWYVKAEWITGSLCRTVGRSDYEPVRGADA